MVGRGRTSHNSGPDAGASQESASQPAAVVCTAAPPARGTQVRPHGDTERNGTAVRRSGA